MTEIRVLEPGETPPGGWQQDERGLRVWKGEHLWHTRHGDALLEWHLGTPWKAFNVSGRGGKIAVVETRSPFEKDVWRFRGSSEAYVTGTLDIRDDGITFNPMILHKEMGDLDEGDLGSVMANSPEFAAALADDGFAFAANEYFKNRLMRRNEGASASWGISFRSIAGLIADIRDKGESYIDFYPWGGDYTDADMRRVVEAVEALGWHEATPEEIAGDHARAMAILLNVEARDLDSVPEEERAPVLGKDSIEPTTPSKRMHVAIRQGKVTRTEYREFFDLLDVDADRESVPVALITLT